VFNIEHWTLDIGHWTLDLGHIGLWTLDFGPWDSLSNQFVEDCVVGEFCVGAHTHLFQESRAVGADRLDT
jgi:hypothetical protein